MKFCFYPSVLARNYKLLFVTFLLSISCFWFVFVGCASVKKYIESPGTSKGQISIFLKGPDTATLDITFDLQAITIFAEDGTSIEIMNIPRSINSVDLTGRQELLCEYALPVGQYKKIQLLVKEAVIKRDERIANLALPQEGIFIDIDITINKNQNTSKFLKWNADASIVDGYLFKPVFSVWGEVPELSTLLIYVTNEDSNNVSVINRQTGDVVATIMVGEKPKGIATSLMSERKRVYVANSGSNSISVIDPTTNEVELEIPIRFGIQPEGIAVARISPERELIFVTNYGSDTVSVVDTVSYREVNKINVGNGPIAIAVGPPIEETISNLCFNVYVVNNKSKNVSILRIEVEASGIKLNDSITVGVQWSPIALAVDYKKDKIYVANYHYDNLSVIDIPSITPITQCDDQFGAPSLSEITNVGTSVIGVILEPELGRIYLLKNATNEIVIIKPFSEIFNIQRATMAMSPIIGTVTVGTSPRSFVLDPEARKIYVVNRGSNSVSVIDKTTLREERTIPVGIKPYGIAIFPLL